ncbi:hypothetical protein [Methanosarcina acetivorans]|uniref:Uncharacterized protein n=1 Tax=Methanosarcina acetivorans (strain ATCC 35395 / DSM 2834 / JCM 12185 / C2A) TaxID=188937 RepID=Q8TR87_METAC|nr:hypothetical protein [Methanosarcina acetivorans]AAM04713.1 predicted protein [Methanosarcina acetivorans C2A]
MKSQGLPVGNLTLPCTSPLKTTLEAAAEIAKTSTVIGSMQARSYFSCVRPPPYSMPPAKRVRISLIITT